MQINIVNNRKMKKDGNECIYSDEDVRIAHESFQSLFPVGSYDTWDDNSDSEA